MVDVHCILARCIVEPEFLALVAQDCRGALKEYQLTQSQIDDFARLDTSAVARFAGFVAKVQHNHLWEDFPRTWSALKALDLELEVFTTFVPTHQRLRKTSDLSRVEKARHFLVFLKEFVQSRQDEYPGLREVLLHEWFKWEVDLSLLAIHCESVTTDCEFSERLSATAFGELVPSVRGVVHIAEFLYDPIECLAPGDDISFTNARTLNPRLLAYWGDSATRSLRIVEIDPLTAAVLTKVDGVHTLTSLTVDLLSSDNSRWTASEIEALWRQAFSIGILVPHNDAQANATRRL